MHAITHAFRTFITEFTTGTAEDLLIGGAMRIFNHCHYAISLEIDCFYALLTRQICA